MLSQQLTIVIPTYNEEKYIWRTLKEINRQFSVKKIKIIIADAKSTDKTVYLINLFKQTYKSNIRISFNLKPSKKIYKLNDKFH
jgi:glycosyltransferase involved in cell wall biosynthesis